MCSYAKFDCKFFLILSISVFQISVVIITENALKNSFEIGVSVPKPLFQTLLSKKNYHSPILCLCHSRCLHFFYAYFFKEKCGIGFRYRNSYFKYFFQKNPYQLSILCSCHSQCLHFSLSLFHQRKLWNKGFGTEILIPNFFLKKNTYYSPILCSCHSR